MPLISLPMWPTLIYNWPSVSLLLTTNWIENFCVISVFGFSSKERHVRFLAHAGTFFWIGWRVTTALITTRHFSCHPAWNLDARYSLLKGKRRFQSNFLIRVTFVWHVPATHFCPSVVTRVSSHLSIIKSLRLVWKMLVLPKHFPYSSMTMLFVIPQM